MENTTKTKFTIAGIVAGIVLPIVSLIYGIKSYNHYVDRIISRNVKEMFPAGNVLDKVVARTPSLL